MSKPAAQAAAQMVRCVFPRRLEIGGVPLHASLLLIAQKLDSGGQLAHHGSLRVPRLIVPAGKATAAPPVGPALGARGVKSIDFVKDFNARTASLVPGTPTPVNITIQADRTFTFTVHTPPTMWLIKQATGIETASGEPGRAAPVATLSAKHIYEIAKIKQRDEHMRHLPLQSIARAVAGSCRSAGVAIVP
ncbi:Ribosomal protein L11, N-terminal domain-domain containing protein [Rhodotorula toruloides]|uniref:Large ribosomal subunit protein uL11m n=1 Tax=Rhodotorula toruloides TaxID=5286 RepID=A0A2T0A002_RHOTO|nr:Ribosomal protein L11, N-terminal domain-domain containing protein [Rhodotorula toruloides]